MWTRQTLLNGDETTVGLGFFIDGQGKRPESLPQRRSRKNTHPLGRLPQPPTWYCSYDQYGAWRTGTNFNRNLRSTFQGRQVIETKMQSSNRSSHRLTIILFALILIVESIGSGTVQAQLIIGHRGASHDAPENTLGAFRLAFEQQADGIEGDFRLTSDGHIVCIHDKNTGRVAKENIVVANSTLAELKRLDVGTWKDKKWAAERIPTLAEVIAVIPADKKFFIELKTGPEIVEPLMKVLRETEFPLEQCIAISFDAETCTQCEQLFPELVVHWLTGYKERTEVDGNGEDVGTGQWTTHRRNSN